MITAQVWKLLCFFNDHTSEIAELLMQLSLINFPELLRFYYQPFKINAKTWKINSGMSIGKKEKKKNNIVPSFRN